MIKKVSIVILAVILSGCGGGGGGGGGNPAAPSLTADFTPATASPASGTVTLQKSSMSGDTVNIDVKITDMNDVFGASIYLNYDPSKVNWSGSSQPGTFLEHEGTPIYMVALSGREGTLVIGISLLAPALPYSGSGTLIKIPFKVIATGTSAISFSVDSELLTPTPNHPAILSWDGGTITGF